MGTTLKRFTLLFFLLSLLLLANILLSLRWEYMHDFPILFYEAFLIDKFHAVPYRDFFDMNMLGTFFFYVLIGKLTHYSQLGVRLFDLSYLVLIMGSTAFFLRKFDWKVSWFAPLFFGLNYLGRGPIDVLQREYILILPTIWLLIIATELPKKSTPASYFFLGFLLSISATIKPQMLLFAVPLLLFYFFHKEQRTSSFLIIPTILGFSLPICGLFFYLWYNQALDSFLDIMLHYFPLYGSLNGQHETVFGLAKIGGRLAGFQYLGGNGLLCIPAILGFSIAIFYAPLSREEREKVVLTGYFTLFAAIYTCVAGQFWLYHWLIFVYFLTLLTSFCFLPIQEPLQSRIQPLIIGIALIALTINSNGWLNNIKNLFGYTSYSMQTKQTAEEIAAFLKTNRKPGDKVQPLDWTSGGIHSLLLAQAPLATSFVYEFHFYHHISNPYIQHLRQRFINELETSKPRFILDMGDRSTEKTRWVSGPDTTNQFSELETILKRDYCLAKKSDKYKIYERCAR